MSHAALGGAALVGAIAIIFISDSNILSELGNPKLTIGNGFSAPACNTSRNFGTDTSFDGIRITGSPQFVSATVDALQKLWYTPSYRRYVKALHTIAETDRGPRNALAWTVPGSGVMWAYGSTARRSCHGYARTITHEGAHNVGIGHGPEMTAVEQTVLRELKSSSQIARR